MKHYRSRKTIRAIKVSLDNYDEFITLLTSHTSPLLMVKRRFDGEDSISIVVRDPYENGEEFEISDGDYLVDWGDEVIDSLSAAVFEDTYIEAPDADEERDYS